MCVGLLCSTELDFFFFVKSEKKSFSRKKKCCFKKIIEIVFLSDKYSCHPNGHVAIDRKSNRNFSAVSRVSKKVSRVLLVLL